jgi:hypothetical protein
LTQLSEQVQQRHEFADKTSGIKNIARSPTAETIDESMTCKNAAKKIIAAFLTAER